MKKLSLLTWLVLSGVLALLSIIELIMGISLWVNEPSVSFWGPSSITFTIVGFISLISFIVSMVYFIKYKKIQNHK